MNAQRRLDQNSEALMVRIPMRLQRRGSRKRIIGPDGRPVVPAATPIRLDDPLLRALARAWRWKRMLDEGRYASVTELAEAEKVNFSYLCRMLRLSLLPPAMVEALLG